MKGSDILRRAGEALYGERWQAPLSRELGVTDRTVRNWAAERNNCPHDVPEKLLKLLRARGEQVNGLTILISQHLDDLRKIGTTRPRRNQEQ